MCLALAHTLHHCLLALLCRKGAEFVLTHIQPQHACMLTAEGGLAVDFIGRTEHIDEDLTTVLAKLEKRRLPSVPSVSATADGGSLRAGPKLSKHRLAVCSWHH